jgi:S1-C subfamily serine protease
VKKPSLKKIAKQPEIPALKIRKDANVKLPAISATWYAITLSEPIGNDLSAYGVSLGEQGIGLENIPTGSRPEKWGFKKGDLLLAVNGQKLSKVTDFAKYMSDKGFEQTHRFLIIRNQQPMTIIVSETLEKIQ